MKKLNNIRNKKRTMSDEDLSHRLTSFHKETASQNSGINQKEMQDLLHELEVSQIELEVQNRELSESRLSIEESHNKYLSLYDFAPVGYMTLDRLGTVLELNLTAADLLGMDRHRMIGRLLSPKIHKLDLYKFREHLLDCRDGEKKVSEKIHLINSEGAPIPIQFSTVAIRGRESGVFTFRTAITDLTEQVRVETDRQDLLNKIETSRNQLYGFFMQSPTPMVILEGANHKYVLVNPPYEKMIGRKVLGKTVGEVFPLGEDISFVPYLDSVFRTGRPFVGKELPLDLPGDDGFFLKRWIDVGYYPFRAESGEITGVMAVHHDVTESVQARQQLEFAKQEAEKATNLKSAFLANMSHEIRTPLGAILGFAEIIKNSDSQNERDKYGSIVSRNGKALTKIIDDILDLSKVEAGKLELERIDFDVKLLVHEIASLFQEATARKNIELKVSVDPRMPNFVCSDPTRIRQILINLVGNGVKFTTKGVISIHAEPKYVGQTLVGINFKIQDTGIGMSKEQIDKVFAPFCQGDSSTTRKFGGSGLGLVLSRRLARALGGDVTLLSSEVTKGATFLAFVEATRVEKSSAVELVKHSVEKFNTASSETHVLLVEDSIDNQLLIKFLLAKAGIRVDVANNGAEGVEMAEKNNYDVVLMDMQMPVLDGYAATEQLRSDGYLKPIVALTAHAMIEDRNRILEMGCNAHLTKPIDARLLIDTVMRVRENIH